MDKLSKTTLGFKFGVLFGLFLTSQVVSAQWEVQWEDSFNDKSVNWNNWTAQTQANYNGELQCYTDDELTANHNYQVSDGTLKIIARRGEVNCEGLNGLTKSWTSGRINTKDKQEFLYGRIEARIRFQDTKLGTWPAFWMLEGRINQQPIKGDNDKVDWPNPGAGEIDIWEWFSTNPDRYTTAFHNKNACGSTRLYQYPNGVTDVADWHVYAMEWSKNNISFYIDETKVADQDISNCPQYKEPMFILLNLAIGGNFLDGASVDSSLQTATLEVDYVKHSCWAGDSECKLNSEYTAPTSTITEGTGGQGSGGYLFLLAALMFIFRRNDVSQWV